MSALETNLRIAESDEFFERLTTLGKQLPEAEPAEVAAALALVLANHIGERAVLDEAVDLARASFPGAARRPSQNLI